MFELIILGLLGSAALGSVFSGNEDASLNVANSATDESVDDDAPLTDSVDDTPPPGEENPTPKSVTLNLDADDTTPQIVADFNPKVDTLHRIFITVGDGDALDVVFEPREDETGTDIQLDGVTLATVLGAGPSDFDDTELILRMDGDGTLQDTDRGTRILIDYDAANTIFGNGGVDTINGFHGDVIYGGAGDDVLRGSGQYLASSTGDMNTLDGGDGDDLILSSNANIITGGAGADVIGLSLSQYNYGATPGSNLDLQASVITDFNADEDILVLEGGLIGQGGGAGSTATPEDVLELRVWDDGTGADIYAGPDLIARITGGQDLTVADIIIADKGLEVELLGYH